MSAAKTKLDHALELAQLGFWLFPLQAGGKKPIKGMHFKEQSSRDPEQLRAWFGDGVCNIGIYTGRFGEDQALLVVDVDNKGEKRGDQGIIGLELQGCDFPHTREHLTPTGGRHLVYRVHAAVKQGVDVLGRGLDIRSDGGYVVGVGSLAAGKAYVCGTGDASVALAPQWLVDRCGQPRERTRQSESARPAVGPAALDRAKHYLLNEAPLSIKGQGGDQTAYKVAAHLKDLGVDEAAALDLMLEHWNPRCPPGWSPEKLQTKIRNAYTYGRDPVGVTAPEAVFGVVEQEPVVAHKSHPFDELNREFAFVIAGGGSHVLWEDKDAYDKPVLTHLDIASFHRKFASRKMNVGKKDEKITELWMESPRRRSYDGLAFMPQLKCPPRFYNLWRGFAYEPAGTYVPHPAVEAWIEHTRDNVCGGDAALFGWLRGYFAHLVQRPWEKPLVALVLRGGKGIGKNSVVERVGALLGCHFLLTSNRRYLVGNFNGHMENLLLFALDEAFWSGDKQAEGQLKDLITGARHVIEHKGKEPYTVENRTRIAIIANEEWAVPASHDERRFAVFDVGDGRKEDRAFFAQMREGMEQGGYPLFLRYLLDVDLAGVDVNAAPRTAGLLEQKHLSLPLVERWWLDCLTSGRIAGGDFESAFGVQVECERLRAAFRRYAREHGRGAYLTDERSFGRTFKKVCPIEPSRQRVSGGLVNTYKLPDLKAARRAWDKFIGHSVEWPAE